MSHPVLGDNQHLPGHEVASDIATSGLTAYVSCEKKKEMAKKKRKERKES
jgi:hypothetical protein